MNKLIDRDGNQHRHHQGDGPGLVEKEQHVVTHERAQFPGRAAVGCADGERRVAEDDQGAVGQHERDAQREDELRVVTFPFGASHLDACSLGEQRLVQAHAQQIHQSARHDRAHDRAHGRAEAEPGAHIKRTVHAQHEELALGEVDDAHQTEDQPESDTHQSVDRADQEPGNDRLHQVFKKITALMACVLRSARSVAAADSSSARLVCGPHHGVILRSGRKACLPNMGSMIILWPSRVRSQSARILGGKWQKRQGGR